MDKKYFYQLIFIFFLIYAWFRIPAPSQYEIKQAYENIKKN